MATRKSEKPSTQTVGNVGLYFACYMLSRLGWNVLPTSRNARGIDILAYSEDGKDFVTIQVKALSKRSPVPLGNSLEKVMGDYWVILNDVAEGPQAYILLPKEVINLAHRGEKEGKVSFWLQPKAYIKPEFRNAWNRIEFGKQRGFRKNRLSIEGQENGQ